MTALAGVGAAAAAWAAIFANASGWLTASSARLLRSSAMLAAVLRDRRVQLLQGAYIARLRDDATVVNYLAPQIVDSVAKVPDVAAVR